METRTHDALVARMVDFNGNTLVEYIAFAIPERSSCLRILPIGHNTTVELIDVLEALVDHERRELLAANPACAIRENRSVFFVTEMLPDPGRKLTKTLHIRSNGTSEVTNIEFVIRASINHDGVAPLKAFFPLGRGETRSRHLIGVRWEISTERDELLFNSDEHLLEGMAFHFINLEDHRGKTWIGMHCSTIGIARFLGAGYRSVKSLGCNENSSAQLQ